MPVINLYQIAESFQTFSLLLPLFSFLYDVIVSDSVYLVCHGEVLMLSRIDPLEYE